MEVWGFGTLMMVVAILGTLAAIAIPHYISYREKAKVARAIVEIKEIERAVFVFTLNSDSLPDTLVAAGTPILQEPQPGPFGMTFTFTDPDGYAVTVHDKA